MNRSDDVSGDVPSRLRARQRRFFWRWMAFNQRPITRIVAWMCRYWVVPLRYFAGAMMKISWIEPGILAASGIPLDEKDIRALHSQGIRAILSLTEQPLFVQREITSELLGALDIVPLHVPVPDQHPPSLAQAHAIAALIRDMAEQQRPLLVHCHAGVGRTGTILHLYYLQQGKTFAEARALIRQKRVQCILLSDTQEHFLQTYRASE